MGTWMKLLWYYTTCIVLQKVFYNALSLDKLCSSKQNKEFYTECIILYTGCIILLWLQIYAQQWTTIRGATCICDAVFPANFQVKGMHWQSLLYRRLAGVPDFLTLENMLSMVIDDRIDPKMVFSFVQLGPSTDQNLFYKRNQRNHWLDLFGYNSNLPNISLDLDAPNLRCALCNDMWATMPDDWWTVYFYIHWSEGSGQNKNYF